MCMGRRPPSRDACHCFKLVPLLQRYAAYLYDNYIQTAACRKERGAFGASEEKQPERKLFRTCKPTVKAAEIIQPETKFPTTYFKLLSEIEFEEANIF